MIQEIVQSSMLTLTWAVLKLQVAFVTAYAFWFIVFCVMYVMTYAMFKLINGGR